MLTEDHLDMLGELVNIAHGKAATLLGSLVGSALDLQAPKLSVRAADSAMRELLPPDGLQAHHYVIAQSFRPLLCGEGVLIVAVEDAPNFRARLRLEPTEPDAGGALEVGNLVMGACVGQLAQLLETHVAYSPPRIAENLSTEQLSRDNAKQQVLLIQTQFHLKSGDFDGAVNLVVPESAWGTLCDQLDEQMERMFGEAS